MRFSPRVHAEQTPDKPAYIMANSEKVVTYAQLEERANRCAHLFRNYGLQVGDHIAIFMENNSHFLEVVWAAQRCGLYYTAVNRHLTVTEVEYIVNDCGAKVLLTSYALRDVARPLAEKLEKTVHKLMADGADTGYEAYEEAVAACESKPVDNEIEGAPMLYSSGTTGRPKGVLPQLDLDQQFDYDEPEIIPSIFDFFHYSKDMTFLSPAPLYHAAPLHYTMAVHRFGGTVIVMDHFETEQSLALIEKYQVTHSQWVPTMFVRMLKLPEETRLKYDISSQKVAIHGASPIAVPTKEKMIDWWGKILIEYYGGTEGNGACVITSEDWLAHRGSVGRSAMGKIHILDEHGEELPVGEIGGIYFSGGATFECYNDPQKTAESRANNGMSTLGDIGCLDGDGFLYLKDRKADMIISGGVNIYPQEAEQMLIEHEDVLDVAVFGIPNEEFGEEVKAVVQPRDYSVAGPELEDKLIAFCRQNLSKIKCPKTVDFKESLPRTPTGKLLKRNLKKEYGV